MTYGIARGERTKWLQLVTNSARHPPGPPQRLFTGSLREFRQDILGFFAECARQYGDISFFRLGHLKCAFINRPDLIEQVLVKDSRHYKKHYAVRFARPILGNGLVTSDGPLWQRQRKLAAPIFQSHSVLSHVNQIVASTTRLSETWSVGEVRSLNADMLLLALDIIAKALFGVEIEDSQRIDDSLRSAVWIFASRSASTIPLPLGIPTPGNLKLRSARRTLDQVVRSIIVKRRKDEQRHDDLLSRLLDVRDRNEVTGMTDQQLLDEVRTFLLAGLETTAISLTWAWYLLAMHPSAQAKLRAESLGVTGARYPQADDLSQFTFAEQVVMEAMRLYSPSFAIGREALVDCELAGYRIPAGCTVFMSQWVMHRDARFFDRPNDFIPERWTTEWRNALPKMAYFPFGGGPRACIGQSLAMMEGVLILATLARKWSLRLANPERHVCPAPLFTLRPGTNIEVILSKAT